jgi:hypothetical protein
MKVLEGRLANNFCNEYIRMIIKRYVTYIRDCGNDRGSTIGLLRREANWWLFFCSIQVSRIRQLLPSRDRDQRPISALLNPGVRHNVLQAFPRPGWDRAWR